MYHPVFNLSPTLNALGSAKAPTAVGCTFFAQWEPSLHLQLPEDHVRLLDQQDSVVKYLIPSAKNVLHPTLTLRNSNQGNIFLLREALERDGTIGISAVIDWQHIFASLSHIPHTAGRRKFFEEKMFAQEEEDDMTWTEMEDAREEITRAVGVSSDGWVPNENYKRVIGVNEMAHMA
ncbi:hypothetical protein BDN70DRAFT_998838 [Pholiota conissans]|uniref:Uncharacterized protein n=1 Tax=Pholiota conissans TaxID=109636 RepID=A0A9P5YJ25_9AGAR|nr:hypothetical protein BDN70DRAFT_998838 [Pholiota conissans]